MSAAVESPRNVTITKTEGSNEQTRLVPWSSSQTSSSSINTTIARLNNSNYNSPAKQCDTFTKTTSSSSSPTLRVNGMISKDDLINSNPVAAASVSNGSVASRRSVTSDNESEDLNSKRMDNSKTNTDGSKKQARRRKANRACSHCQKAHLTCDDSRPCERCVKKGLTDTCTDGARKKAKYLLDEDEILELKRDKVRNKNEGQASTEPSTKQIIKKESVVSSNDAGNPSEWSPSKLNQDFSAPHLVSFDPTATIAPSSLSGSTQDLIGTHENTGTPSAHHNSDSEMYGTLASFSPTSSTGLNVFGSETTSLEYSILSSMLNGIDPAWLSGSPDGQNGTDTDLGRVLNTDSVNQSAFSHMGINGMPWQINTDEVSPWRDSSRGGRNEQTFQVEPLHHMDPTISHSANSSDTLIAYDALEVPGPHGTAYDEDSLSTQSKGTTKANVKVGQSLQNSKRAALAAAAAATGKDKKPDPEWQEKVIHIYSDKMKPFAYTEGYHFLIKYITANLDKADVLRIVRALAIFRPSLIALQMPLSEEDEIFVERSIQRTVLEFRRLVSFSGTPTVVWRRTCEMVVVGAEFSMLTQWSKDHLSGRYIYEFFDKASIVEYWEKFALHAFENTAQSIMMQVTLKTSTGKSVKCTACFSIKRDVFDLPSLIVGNFLPILS